MAKALGLVNANYEGAGMTFNEGAWFNATKAAAFFGKKPIEWLRLPETERYIAALCGFHKVGKSHFVKTRRGTKSPGTWFHPRLAVPFARWCDINFAIWCDDQIAQILEGKHPHFNWKKSKHEASASFKVVMESVKLEREYQGKAVERYHYMNETKMINWCLSGEFKSQDRDALTTEELSLIAKLEVRDAALLGRGMSYKERKAALKLFVDDWKIERIRQNGADHLPGTGPAAGADGNHQATSLLPQIMLQNRNTAQEHRNGA